jgi:hypothetical protein
MTAHQPDMTSVFVEVCLRRLTQAHQADDPLRRLALVALARADLAACWDHAILAAHQAARATPDPPMPRQLELEPPPSTATLRET